jgi:co-chaperonin GroES (HSP10)
MHPHKPVDEKTINRPYNVTMELRLHPSNALLLLKSWEAPDKTNSGIFLPGSNKDHPLYEVMEAGPDYKGSRKVGDLIIFAQGFTFHRGTTLWAFVGDGQILGHVSKEDRPDLGAVTNGS